MNDNPRLYRSPTGEPIRVILDDGRVARVASDWRTLPNDHHNAAVRAGCEVDTKTGRFSASDEAEPRQGAAAPPPASDGAVRVRLLEMLNRDEDGDFNPATGLPDLKVLTGLCGFNVDTQQASRVLKAIKAELQAQADEEQRVAEQAAADQAAAAARANDPDAAAAATEAAEQKRAERQAKVAKTIKKVAKKSAPPKSAATA